jgi:hypothetical protein
MTDWDPSRLMDIETNAMGLRRDPETAHRLAEKLRTFHR